MDDTIIPMTWQPDATIHADTAQMRAVRVPPAPPAIHPEVFEFTRRGGTRAADVLAEPARPSAIGLLGHIAGVILRTALLICILAGVGLAAISLV